MPLNAVRDVSAESRYAEESLSLMLYSEGTQVETGWLALRISAPGMYWGNAVTLSNKIYYVYYDANGRTVRNEVEIF